MFPAVEVCLQVEKALKTVKEQSAAVQNNTVNPEVVDDLKRSLEVRLLNALTHFGMM